MPVCEKCWADAYLRMVNNPAKTQTEHYTDLLDERKDNPCSKEKQKGQVDGETETYQNGNTEKAGSKDPDGLRACFKCNQATPS